MDTDSAAADTRARLGEVETRILEYECAMQLSDGTAATTGALVESLRSLQQLLLRAQACDAALLAHQLLTLVGAYDQRFRPISAEAIDTLLGGLDVLLEVTRQPKAATSLTRPHVDRIMALVAQISTLRPEPRQSDNAALTPSAELPRATPIHTPTPIKRTRRILIVEDDFVSRSLMLAMLEGYGKCDVAVNGLEAVAAVEQALGQSWQYELITLDIMMPELGGHEALAAIRISEATKCLPHARRAKVVMTTALSDYENFHRAYLGSCDAYIVKPLSKAVLVRQLRRVGIE